MYDHPAGEQATSRLPASIPERQRPRNGMPQPEPPARGRLNRLRLLIRRVLRRERRWIGDSGEREQHAETVRDRLPDKGGDP